MKVLLLTKYSRNGASSRLRALQYVPYLRQKGWDVTLRPLLPEAYLDRLYSDARMPAVIAARAAASRIGQIVTDRANDYDLVFLQYELLPGLPFPLEQPLYSRLKPFVVDYDDATFVPYRSRWTMRNKVRCVMSRASAVIVANDFLRTYAEQHNDHVSVIPTVIDLSHYQPKTDYQSRDKLVIGWIGTPITARYLVSVAPALRAAAGRFPVILRAIGAPAALKIPGIDTECVGWSEAGESGLVRSFDVGIMPLVDEPFAHGKSGYKLIQYMGCAVPALGTALGANCEIINDGHNGVLAAGPDEFARKLCLLLGSADLRARLGAAGRRTVETRYSLQVQSATFADVLERAAKAA